VPHQENGGHDQQRMNQPARDVKNDPAENPGDQENKEQREKHTNLLDGAAVSRRRDTSPDPPLASPFLLQFQQSVKE
jgi:hypothetical protein